MLGGVLGGLMEGVTSIFKKKFFEDMREAKQIKNYVYVINSEKLSFLILLCLQIKISGKMIKWTQVSYA